MPGANGDAEFFDKDVAKTLVGSFAGAGLAFLSNWWFQRRAEVRDNLASGRRALFTLRSQLDDFINYRYAIRHGVHRIQQELGDAPEWAYARPVGFNFRESNVFDLKSLAFLLSSASGRAAFERLQFTERTYLDLAARHSDFNSSTQELQRRLGPFHQDNQLATLQDLENHAGPELIARMRDHQRAIVLRVVRDEPRYRKAFNVLNDVMTEMFGSEATMSQPSSPEKYREANLPQLPQALRTYVDSIPHSPE